jgi:hypothetical protein
LSYSEHAIIDLGIELKVKYDRNLSTVLAHTIWLD